MLPCDAGQTIKQMVLVCQPILFNIVFISTNYSASCNAFSTIEFESTIRSNLKNSKVDTYPETKFPCLCHTLCGNFVPMEPEARAGVTTFSTSSLGYSQFSAAHGKCYKNTETRFKSTGWQRQNTTWIIGCSNPVGFWSYFI